MRNSRQIRKLWCGILLGSFILTGCSQTGSQEDYSVTEEEVMTQTKTEQQTEQQTEELTGREILESLIEDKGFCERVWYDAEMNEEDTKEMILEKLNHCENLILREPPYGNATFSLEGLRLMPNLQCLIIDFSIWDDSNIEDFTPILELSQLKELYFSYASEEKIDLSFLAQMPSITELYLPNCNLEGIDFLGEMPQLERLSLYETYVEDLSVLEKLPKLVELALSGNAEAANIEVVGKLLLMEEFQGIMEKYTGQYKDNRSKIQRRDTIRAFGQETERVREHAFRYRDVSAQLAGQRARIGDFIRRLHGLEGQEREKAERKRRNLR